MQISFVQEKHLISGHKVTIHTLYSILINCLYVLLIVCTWGWPNNYDGCNM